MRFRSALGPLSVALLFLLTVTAPLGLSITREFAQSYPLNSDGSFELNNINGSVLIEGWDKNVVEVRAVKTAADREAQLDLVSIDVASRPDALAISTRYPQDEGVEVAVDYTVHVPRRAQLAHVNNVNGALKVMDLESIGDLHTVNGNIEILDSSGDIHAHTTNGNVYLELKHPADARGALAETTNGSVLLAIPANLHADLEARCMNGSFSTELPVIMQGVAQPRVLHGKLGHGGAPIRLATVNGTIRVVALRSTV